jgi:hypothetical protein
VKIAASTSANTSSGACMHQARARADQLGDGRDGGCTTASSRSLGQCAQALRHRVRFVAHEAGTSGHHESTLAIPMRP